VITNDSNHIWVGGVNGGVWRTSDGGQSWKILTDSLPSQSISHLSFDLTDPTYRTIVASVGGTSSFAALDGQEVGIYISTDAGDTWTNPTFDVCAPIGCNTMAAYKIGNRVVMCVTAGAGGAWYAPGKLTIVFI